MKRPKIVIRPGKNGQYHFNVVAKNGEVVSTSETYSSKQMCLKGISALKDAVAEAEIVDETPISKAQN